MTNTVDEIRITGITNTRGDTDGSGIVVFSLAEPVAGALAKLIGEWDTDGSPIWFMQADGDELEVHLRTLADPAVAPAIVRAVLEMLPAITAEYQRQIEGVRAFLQAIETAFDEATAG